jgi:hypothetical protein
MARGGISMNFRCGTRDNHNKDRFSDIVCMRLSGKYRDKMIDIARLRFTSADPRIALNLQSDGAETLEYWILHGIATPITFSRAIGCQVTPFREISGSVRSK